MRKTFFALGYTRHRLWGNIIIPYMVIIDENNEFYSMLEVVIKDEATNSYRRLTPMQKKVVDIIDEYSDKNLHKIFSKRKTIKEFHDKVDSETIAENIRPFIEKRLSQVIELSHQHNFRIFQRFKVSQNIFEEDFLKVQKEPAKPYFHFHRTNEGTIYYLSVIHKNKKLDFRDHHAELISNDPCIVLLDNQLLFVEEIKGKKLLPFFKKKHIVVPPASEKKYYSSFISNTLRAHDFVEIEGFTLQDIHPQKSAKICLEYGINQHPSWILTLRYDKVTIYPSSKQQRFVQLKHENNSFEFTRFSRDVLWEEMLCNFLSDIGLKTRDETNYTLSKSLDKQTEDKIYDAITFTNENFDYLTECGFTVEQNLADDYYLKWMKLDAESSEHEDWFDIKMIIKISGFEFPFTALKKNILQGERTYILPEGSKFVIPEEWFSRYKSLFEFGSLENNSIRIHKQHFSQVDKELAKKHASTIAGLEKLNRISELPDIKIPEGLNVVMRNYQLEGFAWLWLLQQNGFGGCLADDMGLGKTIQAIAILALNKEKYFDNGSSENQVSGQLSLFSSESNGPTSLVVVPASLLQNWINEITRFLPEFKILLHAGNTRDRNTLTFNEYDIVISSYHTVRQDIEFVSEFNFQYVILDESQSIKNPHSKLYRAMLELQSNHKLVLTGTPIENSLTDLWSQINFVNEGLLGSLNFFKKQFVNTIEKKNNKKQEQRLKELVNPFILRRTKEEVAKELPPVYEQYRFCTMTDEQKTMYEEEKSSVRNQIIENLEDIGLNNSALMVLKALTRLRQISNHPLMVEEDYAGNSGKYDEVFRNIESVVSEGHKVLVFSSFVKHLGLYAKKLDQMNWKYAWLTGSTRDRDAEVLKFQEDQECCIFLISLKAGGVGLNLTAADYVFILDPWWNPAAEMQALSRAHRIGQDKNVFVYRFISTQTVEEKIVRLQERKSELAKTFVTSNNPLRNMKKEEVMELFN